MFKDTALMAEVEPLDPENLTPSASLNRMRIGDVADVGLADDERGKLAFDLLSAAEVARLIREQPGLDLTWQERAAGTDLPYLFDSRFDAGDARVRGAAEDVARVLGRRLAALLLTLRRGDAESRRSRPDWDDSYWQYWAATERIWLGGGLVSGNLGRHTLHYARQILAAGGLADLTVEIARHPTILPLIGAARSVPTGYDAAVVLDFGGSRVKRALARYFAGSLAGLRELSSVLSPEMPKVEESVDALLLGYDVVDMIAETWRSCADIASPGPALAVSIASYLRDGQPLPRQGAVYTGLRDISPKLEDWLAGKMSDLVGLPMTIRLLHDGTAAARVYAGAPRSAVIMLGTALGIGFPGNAAGLRPLANDFAVT